jgi:diaminobutyrate-2-oxoglutarate transaminase
MVMTMPTRAPETRESQVRSYARSFPGVFATAKGEWLRTEDGTRYLDFLSGAGTLNYGHNPERVKRRLLDYLEQDGVVHGLDLATTAKGDFLDAFVRHVLEPRGLDYRIQFTSPSGTNAVEAALKLCRLQTGRSGVVSFSGAFHGVSTGSLAATGADYYKRGLYGTLPSGVHLPYPSSPLGDFDTLDLLRRVVDDPSSGVEKPAAVLLETVQGEGGVHVAPVEFLRGLREFCDARGILLVVDDIQAGCGRTGAFFSFERAGIVPDVVTLSKSIGGYGLPMAITLFRPELDIWRPGQHNGTFLAATAVIEEFWSDGVDGAFVRSVREKGEIVAEFFARSGLPQRGATLRGLGLMRGIDFSGAAALTAGKVSRLCFDQGLIIEVCGREDEVLKILPPLTISEDSLRLGLGIVAQAVRELGEDAQ